MRRSFKFLLRPTSKQVIALTQMLRDHCSLYNGAPQAFFRRVKAGQTPGYPRFRGVGWFNTVEFPKDGDAALHGRIRRQRVDHAHKTALALSNGATAKAG